VAAAVVITGLGIAAALTGGILGVILAGAFWGALAGGLIGGAVGGIAAAINGGSFLEGFADGALSGAISGAVTGAACAGLGALGALAGKSIQCMSTVGKAINVTSKVTAALLLVWMDLTCWQWEYHCLIHPMHWLNSTGSCIPMHFITDSRLL